MAPKRPRRSVTLALCTGYFLVLLDVTVVNVALPQIGSQLDAGSAGLAWVVDAYSVPLAALLLASGMGRSASPCSPPAPAGPTARASCRTPPLCSSVPQQPSH
jgi:MFS family permease